MKSINVTKDLNRVITSLPFSTPLLSSIALFLYCRSYRQVLKYKLCNYTFYCSFGIKTDGEIISQITPQSLLQV